MAHHQPSSAREQARRRRENRNLLWTSWLRYPPAAAWSTTVRVLRAATGDRQALLATLDALRELLWVVRARRSVAPAVAAALDRLLRDRVEEPVAS